MAQAVTAVVDDAAGWIGDLRDVAVGIIAIVHGVDDAGRRLLLLGDPAERVVGPIDRARCIVDLGDAALAVIAAGGGIPGVGDVLGRRGRILLGEQPAGIVVGQVGDDAAAIGDLGRLAERVVGVDRDAAVGTGALDHVGETVADIGRAERARIAVIDDLVLAVARQIDGRAVLIGLADEAAQRIKRPLIDVGAWIGHRYAVVGLIVGMGPGLRCRSDESEQATELVVGFSLRQFERAARILYVTRSDVAADVAGVLDGIAEIVLDGGEAPGGVPGVL